jgi:hypothetical protein
MPGPGELVVNKGTKIIQWRKDNFFINGAEVKKKRNWTATSHHV